jgi:hypothetical protein
MGEATRSFGAQEPHKWALIFNTKAANWWSGVLALGHFKHVCAIGQIPRSQWWVLYDVQFGRTQLAVGLLRDILNIAAPAEQPVEMMWMTPRLKRRFFPPAFLCTTAICHLLGLKCVARPDALWKLCLLNGGEVVSNGEYAEAATAGAEPDVRHAGATGGERPA